MEVNPQSLESLQAYAYRLISQMEATQKELQSVNQAIVNFKEPVEAPIEEVKTDSVPEVEAEKVQ